jgi:nucleoside-diphosphate-sugar epimerase
MSYRTMKIDEGKLKVLVTGASGFLGSHVAEQLSQAGHEVVALVRKSSNRKFLETLPNVNFAYGAVEDAHAVDQAVRGVDAIVHSAGLVKARGEAEFEKTNVEGTKNLLASVRNHAPGLKRFVFVSSLTAVGPSHD